MEVMLIDPNLFGADLLNWLDGMRANALCFLKQILSNYWGQNWIDFCRDESDGNDTRYFDVIRNTEK